jgi:acyl homoserine lactone synthase
LHKFVADGFVLKRGLATATYELFAGMIEFGLSRQLTDIVTVTMLEWSGSCAAPAGLCGECPLRRIGKPHAIGNTLAAAREGRGSVSASM